MNPNNSNSPANLPEAGTPAAGATGLADENPGAPGATPSNTALGRAQAVGAVWAYFSRVLGRLKRGGSELMPAQPAQPPYTGYGVALLACLAIVSALHWSWYPLFVDTYYHMAVIQGMKQAGGLPTWAFWEMAPGGRVHIYPPAIHVVGFLATFLGVSPVKFITLLSWVLYPAALAATWLWLRKVFSPRIGLIAVILLCGSTAIFWNQTTFNANAFSMTLAPLALLALESERFMACGVLNLLASTAHPMGLFLPPALVINTLLRRKQLTAGLAAACLPMVLYAPWLGHIWANRAYLPEERTGGDISLMGIGVGSALNLGLALSGAAVLGIIWMLICRRKALGLLGPCLGFAVVVPMGFGGRFFQFNIHWVLACLGAYGVGMSLEWLENRLPRWQSLLKTASVGLAFLVMATWAAVEVPMPKKFGGPGGRGGFGGPPRNQAREVQRTPVTAVAQPVRFSVGLSQFVQLFDPETRPAPFGGGAGPMGRGGMGAMPGGPGGGFPGPGPQPGGGAQAPGFTFGGRPGRMGAPRDPLNMRGNRDTARPGGRGGFGGGLGMPGSVNPLQQEGAREFFEAVQRLVAEGEIVYFSEGPSGSLLTGATGCWTTGGILRDVRSAESRARADECHFVATFGAGAGVGGPGFMSGRNPVPSEGFSKVFENSFGALWKNDTPLPKGVPTNASVSTLSLFVLAVVGLLLIALDFRLAHEKVRPRRIIAGVAFLIACCSLANLAWTAAGELRHPTKPSAAPTEMPFGGPPPGFGPGGVDPGAPDNPEDIPQKLRAKFDQIQQFIGKTLMAGGDPSSVWSPEDQMRFRRLLEEGKVDEAEVLLNQAAQKMK